MTVSDNGKERFHTHNVQTSKFTITKLQSDFFPGVLVLNSLVFGSRGGSCEKLLENYPVPVEREGEEVLQVPGLRFPWSPWCRPWWRGVTEQLWGHLACRQGQSLTTWLQIIRRWSSFCKGLYEYVKIGFQNTTDSYSSSWIHYIHTYMHHTNYPADEDARGSVHPALQLHLLQICFSSASQVSTWTIPTV